MLGEIRVPVMTVHFAVALALVGTVYLGSALWGWSPLSATASLAALAYVLIALLVTDVVVFFLAFTFMATLGPMVASNVYIEFGNRISEQGVDGTATGATTRLVAYCLLFFGALYLTARPLIDRVRARPSHDQIKRFTVVARFGSIAVLVLAGVVLLVNGSPLLRKQDRFNYWDGLPEVFNRLPLLIAMACFLVACATVFDATVRGWIWASSIILASAGVLLLFSEKFTGLFQIFLFVVMAAYTTAIYHNGARIRILRLAAICVGAALVLLITASMGYIVFYGYTLETVLPKLTDRVLALHGHVWFGMDRSLQDGTGLGPWTALFSSGGGGALSGTQQLMYLVAPDDFVDRMIDQGVRFANTGFPLPVWVLGYGWSIPFFVCAGAFAGLIVAFLFRSIARLRVISILIALNGLRQLGNAFLAGDLSDIYKPLALLTWAWIVAELFFDAYRGQAQRGRSLLREQPRQ